MFSLSLTIRRSQAPFPAILPVSVTSGRSPPAEAARTTDSASSSRPPLLARLARRGNGSPYYPEWLGAFERT